MFLISVAKVVRFSQSEAKANFENFGKQSEKIGMNSLSSR